MRKGAETMMLPNTVLMILENLISYGYEAYIVGGCVRDILMGVTPKDWDITTDAFPEMIRYIFNNFKTIDIGARHGTIGVLIEGDIYEITTYRADGNYIDNRKPEYVKFVKDIKLDLSRRDFTINAMAYNHKEGLIDLFGGSRDIEARIVRCVGDPSERLKEDALRILRALRFSSEKGFEIDEKTYEYICKYKDLLKNISRERISEELKKLLMGKYVGYTLKEYGQPLTAIFSCLNLDDEFLKNSSMKFSKVNAFESRLALLFIDHYLENLDIVDISEAIDSLRLDKKTRNKVIKLISGMRIYVKHDRVFVKRLLRDYGKETVIDLLELRELYFEESIDCFKDLIKQIEEDNICFSLKQLAVNGDDLIYIGLPKGKLIGNILNKLLEEVIEETICNSKDELVVRAKAIVNEEDK